MSNLLTAENKLWSLLIQLSWRSSGGNHPPSTANCDINEPCDGSGEQFSLCRLVCRLQICTGQPTPVLHSDTPLHSLKSANKTWTAHQSWVRCHGAQWRFMEGEEMWWREHFTTHPLQKTLTRRRSYFYTVIITEADRHTDGDQRGKRTKRVKKRTKRVHFLPKIHQKYLEEWCIPKQKQIRDVSSRLSLCY